MHIAQLHLSKAKIMTTFIKSIVPLVLFTLIFSCKDNNTKTQASITPPSQSYAINNITINNPKTVENLSIFMLSGKEKITGKSYDILSQAMQTKKVIVNETGNVNELSITNNSDDYVFIHSGDIVKGGKQDRTISYDVIIPPNAKNIPLESFCVEQGRWQQRANETVASFSTNTKMLSSRELKLAAKYEKDQGKVWNRVAKQKKYLSDKLSDKNGYTVDVADDESNTSLELALENKELKKEKEAFLNQLKALINTPEAIGYAYTINGEIYGVEVYNNQQLFKDLWGKILESIVVEAISKDGDNNQPQKTKKDVLDYMKAAKDTDKKTEKKLNVVTNFKTTKTANGNIVFTTEDLKQQQWVHKSYMKVDSTTTKSNKRFRNTHIEYND